MPPFTVPPSFTPDEPTISTVPGDDLPSGSEVRPRLPRPHRGHHRSLTAPGIEVPKAQDAQQIVVMVQSPARIPSPRKMKSTLATAAPQPVMPPIPSLRPNPPSQKHPPQSLHKSRSFKYGASRPREGRSLLSLSLSSPTHSFANKHQDPETLT